MDDGNTIRVYMQGGRFRLEDDGQELVHANEFLRTLEVRGLSLHTVRAYAYDFVVLFRWLKQCQRQLEDLSQEDLLDYVEMQRKGNAHPNSINRRLTTCRLLYSFVTNKQMEAGRGAISPAPYYKGRGRDRHLGLHVLKRQQRRVLRVQVPRRLVEPLTQQQQVCTFLRSLRRYRDLAIVYLMLLCGLRSREVLGLQLDDVDYEQRHLRVIGKGDKERVLPLPRLLWQTIDSYLRFERPRDEGGALFVVLQGKKRGQAMTYEGLRSLFRHRRLDPTIAMANPHRFRHTFGVEMARTGMRLPTLQKLMGHAQAATTLQYINLSMADVADEYQRVMETIQRRYDRP